VVAIAIGGAAILGAGASIYGASKQSSAAGAASAAQQHSADLANQTQLDMFNQTKATLQPWSDQGLQTYSTLNNLLGVGGTGNSTQMQDALSNLPGYQFTLGQGLKSTQNAAAARGLGVSGGALKGAASYATGLANSTYGNYVNQLQTSANTGESAANALAGYGTQTGQNISGNQIGAGNAAAAGLNAQGAAAANGANGVANSGNSLAQYYTLNSLLGSTNQAQGGGNGLNLNWATQG
jgi:hypothetical protein